MATPPPVLAALPEAPTRRLPGITFVDQPPPPDDVLPRMDIAGFVGFAETGPVDVPVVVTDAAQFTEVFGGPVALLHDAVTGERVGGYLAAAVASFFAHGGRRCWVVRVTGRGGPEPGAPPPSTAARAQFPVHGLAVLNPAGQLEQAFFPARAVGAWADAVAVSAGLLAVPVEVADVAVGNGTRIEPGAAGDAVDGPPGVSGVSGTPGVAVRCRLLGGRVVPRDLLQLAYPEGRLMFAVVSVEPASAGGGSAVHVEVRGTGPVWLPAPAGTGDGSIPDGPVVGFAGTTELPAVPALNELPAVPATPVAAHVFTLELRARVGAARTARTAALSDLGFVPGHPRFAGDLPTDEALYSSRLTLDGPRLPEHGRGALWAEAASPRFPLAGPPPLGPGARVLYPVGLGTGADVGYVGALPDSRSRLDRDGLAAFSPSLFLDPDLAGLGPRTLLATAELLRDTGAAARPLAGIHALLALDEVALLAVPDAVHRSWLRSDPDDEPPPPPPTEHYTRPVACTHREPDDDSRPRSGFYDRDTAALDAPALSPALVEQGGTVRLSWPWPGGEAGVLFVLEESTRFWTWTGATEVYRGGVRPTAADADAGAAAAAAAGGAGGGGGGAAGVGDVAVTLYGRTPGTYYYRLRAETAAAASDWSDPLTVVLPAGERWVLGEGDGDSSAALADLHAAVLTACAARGDLFAVLAARRGSHADDVCAHAAAVRLAVARRAGGSDDRTRSFGALYHPWPVPGSGVAEPPDGATAGVYAATALARGCWVAPANVALTSVVALVPEVGPELYGMLQDARVNTLRREPRGFLTLCADTLSSDPDLGQVTVRRLLSLVRRLAAGHGPGFVFEPNDAVCHRGIRRQFESVFGVLLARGAFAGPTPAESFQVSAAGDGEGRLVVELRVAPSVPLRFLTVRLVNTGDGSPTLAGA